MSSPPVEGFSLQTASDLADVRAEWQALAARSDNVFATWEWADAWRRHLAPNAALRVAVARRPDGEAFAIVPLARLRRRTLRVARFVGAGPADQLGPVHAPQDAAAAAAALRAHVDDVLEGSGIFVGERLWGAEPIAGRLGADPLRRAPSPVLPTNGRTFSEFLRSRSRNFRDQVVRRERRLMREHRLEYRLTTDPERLEHDMRTLIGLHHARWSGGQSRAFGPRRAAFHLDFAQRALENGWLRLWTMELDGRPVAAWYGLRFGGVDVFYQAGRDPACDRGHVGFVLMCHTIRSTFEEGMREYRFGLGGESYKFRFAEYDCGLDTVAITAGPAGRLALGATRAFLRTPPPVRRSFRRARGRYFAGLA